MSGTIRPMVVHIVVWPDAPPEAFLDKDVALARIVQATGHADAQYWLDQFGCVPFTDDIEEHAELYTCEVKP